MDVCDPGSLDGNGRVKIFLPGKCKIRLIVQDTDSGVADLLCQADGILCGNGHCIKMIF